MKLGSRSLENKPPRRFGAGNVVLLYHRLRREELCTLKVRDIHPRRGVLHLWVHGGGGKVRYLPLHPGTSPTTSRPRGMGKTRPEDSPTFKVGYW